MKIYNYKCRNCGHSFNNLYKKVDGYICLSLESRSGCPNCKSKDITHYTVSCEECKEYTLIFDDIRMEIACTNCGLVHAGTDPKTSYPLGFLLKHINLHLKEKRG